MTSKIEKSNDSLLWEIWKKNLRNRPDSDVIVYWSSTAEPHRWTYRTITAAAAGYSNRLRDARIKPGEVCGLIFRHNKEFYPLYMGVSLLGAIPAVLAYPNPRLHPDKFREGLAGMARTSGLDWILTEDALKEELAPVLEDYESAIRDVLFPVDSDETQNPDMPELDELLQELRSHTDPDRPCLLQHSSGTTGLQKAVVLSHRAVIEHLRNYANAINLSHDDKVVSWLPLYHDMGLIAAFHLPLAFGIPSVQLDPFEWVQAPAAFLQALSAERGTLSWLPNFSYNFMADRIRDEELNDISLDSVRLFVNCSEPVREESHRKFRERFEPYGLPQGALGACYAMAETVFAVSQTTPGCRAPSVTARADALAQGRFIPAEGVEGEPVRVCVSSGSPIDGCEIQIVDEDRKALPTGHVGEIAIRSDTLFDGYRNRPAETAEVLEDGWYFSGDYGFVHEGHCYVIGRKKDTIIVAGHNIAPEDLEHAVNQLAGVIPGRAVAFGAEDRQAGTEKVCVAVETSEYDATAQKRLFNEIRKVGMQIDVTVHGVYLLPARWLIKSSSGKLSRKANRERVLELFGSVQTAIHPDLQ